MPYKFGPCDVKTLYNIRLSGATTNFPKYDESITTIGINIVAAEMTVQKRNVRAFFCLTITSNTSVTPKIAVNGLCKIIFHYKTRNIIKTSTVLTNRAMRKVQLKK